jgi:hypothetical protein
MRGRRNPDKQVFPRLGVEVNYGGVGAIRFDDPDRRGVLATPIEASATPHPHLPLRHRQRRLRARRRQRPTCFRRGRQRIIAVIAVAAATAAWATAAPRTGSSQANTTIATPTTPPSTSKIIPRRLMSELPLTRESHEDRLGSNGALAQKDFGCATNLPRSTLVGNDRKWRSRLTGDANPDPPTDLR